jgi:hypothetical protein
MPRRSQDKSAAASDLDANALALLKILELGERNIQEGKVVPASVAMARFRQRLKQGFEKRSGRKRSKKS